MIVGTFHARVPKGEERSPFRRIHDGRHAKEGSL
jgi:hypothetical protein